MSVLDLITLLMVSVLDLIKLLMVSVQDLITLLMVTCRLMVSVQGLIKLLVVGVQDPMSAVSRLSDFLGADASPELCAEVAEATSLAKLRSADKDKQQHKLPPYQIYRKGIFHFL